jgi:hypothetical protein
MEVPRVGLKKTKPTVDLKDGEGVALVGNDSENLFRRLACRFGGAWVQAIKDKGDEVLRSGSGANKVKGGELNGRSFVSDRELRGLKVKDWLMTFVKNNEIDRDFVPCCGFEGPGSGRIRPCG